MWAADKHKIYGFYIKHDKDVFDSSAEILAEKKLDNRYLSMLWSLVEHFVFVDNNVRDMIDSDATVHLHVASRILFIDSKDEEKEKKKTRLESLGYFVKTSNQKSGSYFAYTLDGKELTTMIRMALRQRWKESNIKFGRIENSGIQYQMKRYKRLKPAMGLYLADLFLGQTRSKYYSREKGRFLESMIQPNFSEIKYGPWLETLAEMQAALDSGDIESFFLKVQKFYSYGNAVVSFYQSIHEGQTAKAAKLLSGDLAKLKLFMQRLTKKVDLPGEAEHHVDLVNWTEKLIRICAPSDYLIQVLHLQCRLSICNHTGDVQGVDRVWQEFLKIEPELYIFGTDGLRIRSEMRNRRAVSLTDRFQYSEAESILLDIISLQQGSLKQLAKGFGINAEDIPSDELGACYGTLGQIYAFTGLNESIQYAERSFRQAIELFKNSSDINRQWIYLGHLACDQGESGVDLWNEVQQHLPDLGSPAPILETGREFELALQLKGLHVFGSREMKVQFCTQWEKTSLHRNYSKADKSSHPFGFIYQSVAMIYQDLWHQNRENNHYDQMVTTYYNRSSNLMGSKIGLLKILGLVAELRKCIFKLKRNPAGKKANENIPIVFRSLKENLIELFSSRIWSEDGDGKSDGYFGQLDPGANNSWQRRARAVLAGFRFNYW
jgi:hypothetical protein